MTDVPPTDRRAAAAAPWLATPWDDVALFIGPSAHRFEQVWAKTRDGMARRGSASAQGWCWPALFFGFAWFFYRRLWWWGVGLLVVPLALVVLLPVQGVGTGLAAAMALLGKGVYVQHAVTRAAGLRDGGASDAEIAAAGGVSWLGGAIGAAIYLLLVAGAVLALSSADPANLGRL